MKLVLLLIAVTAVSAHWTHDESLAREIGPPPGEEDVDVANLGEEAQTGAVKQYRITFGTSVVEGTLGASMSQFKVHLKGAKMKLRKTAKETGSKGWVEDKNWRTSDDAVIRYYQGVGMPYAKAKKEAPALHPGMTPLVDTMKAGCSNAVKGKVKPCPRRQGPRRLRADVEGLQAHHHHGDGRLHPGQGHPAHQRDQLRDRQGHQGPQDRPDPARPVHDGGRWQDRRC